MSLCLCWLISAGLIGSYRFLTNWSFFSLRDLNVQGNTILSREEILRTAKLGIGQNALSVSIAGIEHRLIEHSWIKEVLVHRILPKKLVITIEERVPHFWVKKGSSIFYADKKGQCIAPVTAERFILLPFLSWNGSDRQQEVLNTISGLMTKDNSIFRLKDLAWIRFVDREFLEFFVQDWEIKVIICFNNLQDNWRYFREVWRDLLQRNELKKVSKIMAYNRMGWVRLSEN